MIWIIIGIVAAFVIWFVLTLVLLVREDNRIRTESWMRSGIVVRSTAVQLAREARETDRLLDWAAELLPDPA